MRIKIRWGKLGAALFITCMVLLVLHITFDAQHTIAPKSDGHPSHAPITFWLGDVNALLKARPDFVTSTAFSTDPLERSFGRAIVLQDLPHPRSYESPIPPPVALSAHIPAPHCNQCDTLLLSHDSSNTPDSPIRYWQLNPDPALSNAGFTLTRTNLPPGNEPTKLCFDLVFAQDGHLEYALGITGDRTMLRMVESFLMRSARTTKATSGRITMEW